MSNHCYDFYPFPEVTDLFCRLPLPTLFYQLEAAHLGDLLRLWVRPDKKMNDSLRFSRAVLNQFTCCNLNYTHYTTPTWKCRWIYRYREIYVNVISLCYNFIFRMSLLHNILTVYALNYRCTAIRKLLLRQKALKERGFLITSPPTSSGLIRWLTQDQKRCFSSD